MGMETLNLQGLVGMETLNFFFSRKVGVGVLFQGPTRFIIL